MGERVEGLKDINFIFSLTLMAFTIRVFLEFFHFHKPPDCRACVTADCIVPYDSACLQL